MPAVLVQKKTHIYFAVELSLKENFLLCVHARAQLWTLMTRKSCAVGMRNAILRNHFQQGDVVFTDLLVVRLFMDVPSHFAWVLSPTK